MIKHILKEMRVKHYVKNILCFAPLIFSLNLTAPSMVLSAALAFFAFCAASSAVYVINDIADIKKDRLHPKKKHRPIASGAISLPLGTAIAVMCLGAGVFLAFYVSTAAGVLLLVYLSINLMYSFGLKNLALVDVFCVMLGFLLRVYVGAAAVDVPVSGWLMLTVMALSLFMGFGKRRGEIQLMTLENTNKKATSPTGNTRRVLEAYTESFLDKAVYSMMCLSITFYALWAISPDTIENLGTQGLIYTTPLVVAALLRYTMLLEKNREDGDPTGLLLSDPALLILGLLYGAVVVGLVYFNVFAL